jgi:hypothetical protein
MAPQKDRTHMNLLPCSLASSILEGDLELAAQQQTLDKLIVMETPEGFYVIARFLWAKGKDWYLTTRRNRTEPRLYKDLIRLNKNMKEIFPTIGFELLRNQHMPPAEVEEPVQTLTANPGKAKKPTKRTPKK